MNKENISLEKVHFKYCNMCGKELDTDKDILMEDALIIRKEWGYFSEKDCEVHNFLICEKCYDNLIKSFKLPIEVSNKNEVLSS